MTYEGKAAGGRRRKSLPPLADQQTIGRGEQLMIMRKCVLPSFDGEVSASTLKLIVLNIGDHLGTNAECWQSQETIVAETGIKRRQVQRAIKALEALNLIYVRRAPKPQGGRGGTTNRYRVIWNELKRLVPPPTKEWFESRDQSASTGALVAVTNDATKAPVWHDQSASNDTTNAPVLAHKAPTEATKKRPPPPKPPESKITWEAVVGEFEERQAIAQELASEHRTRGFSPAEFQQRMQEAWETASLPENAGKLNDPGASVAWFLRRGSWPVAGIVALHTVAKRRAAKGAAAEKEAVERAKNLRAEAEARQIREVLQQRERDYGDLLNRLRGDELRSLIELTPVLSDPFHAAAATRAVLSPPPTGFVRSRLLETLEACGATPADFACEESPPVARMEQPFWQRGTVR